MGGKVFLATPLIQLLSFLSLPSFLRIWAKGSRSLAISKSSKFGMESSIYMRIWALYLLKSNLGVLWPSLSSALPIPLGAPIPLPYWDGDMWLRVQMQRQTARVQILNRPLTQHLTLLISTSFFRGRWDYYKGGRKSFKRWPVLGGSHTSVPGDGLVGAKRARF